MRILVIVLALLSYTQCRPAYSHGISKEKCIEEMRNLTEELTQPQVEAAGALAKVIGNIVARNDESADMDKLASELGQIITDSLTKQEEAFIEATKAICRR